MGHSGRCICVQPPGHCTSTLLKVCFEVFEDPVFCGGRPCQHVFCRTCVEQSLVAESSNTQSSSEPGLRSGAEHKKETHLGGHLVAKHLGAGGLWAQRALPQLPREDWRGGSAASPGAWGGKLQVCASSHKHDASALLRCLCVYVDYRRCAACWTSFRSAAGVDVVGQASRA